MITDINSEDRAVQQTFAEYLHQKLGWDSEYAWNHESFGPDSMLGRESTRDVVLTRDLREAIQRLNDDLPESAVDVAVRKLTGYNYARSTLQHNQEFHRWIRDGVPVTYKDKHRRTVHRDVKVIDFRNAKNNRFLVVRELKLQGLRSPHYNRRADVVCFINGLPVVFIELKNVWTNIRNGYDQNLADYKDTIPHAFYHNAFLVVSNGDEAKYGSITSPWEYFYEWKRNSEEQKTLQAKAMLDGMFTQEKLLDLIENFVIFDESKAGQTRKIVARNHQVLGVNRAVASVVYQEELKQQFSKEERFQHRLATIEVPDRSRETAEETHDMEARKEQRPRRAVELPLIERAHPDLGRLGVFWHTQGSGKSYSMVFFAEKVRRVVPGNFTFLVMTDRDDLDDQIYKTFVGTGVCSQKTPRASSAKALEKILGENHRFVFTLIQKFRRDELPKHSYSERDDIIVMSDEAHRTQAGKLARNMRIALPNAAFIGFTGTPLLGDTDYLTKRIFGSYVSTYNFKRAEEDGATVKLVYENRGEKLGLRRIDLNDAIAEKIEEANLDDDEMAKIEKLLGKSYEVITADERLDRIAEDFVQHCSARWETGKMMLVCIDKVTCARMYERVIPRWKAKAVEIRKTATLIDAQIGQTDDSLIQEALVAKRDKLIAQADWMDETLIQIIISEEQGEVATFKKWGFDIKPHRAIIKEGFATPDGKRIDVETAFKKDDYPFRVGIVCAMWLTGFDVETLSTLYIDKPMRAHTLMQAIARANRVAPGKDCGVIVDYNGMLGSLRKALADYAAADPDDDTGDPVEPIEERIAALIDAIEAAEDHVTKLGFDWSRFENATGFDRIEAIMDAVEAVRSSEEEKRKYEILAMEVIKRFRALNMEPSVYQFAERRDNIEAIYKKILQKRTVVDVSDVLKELHKIVNQAIGTAGPGDDHADGLILDLSEIDFDKLKDEFARKGKRKRSAVQDIADLIEQKVAMLVAVNPLRMDYYKKYQEIIADYNREKDRVTIEDTFRRLLELNAELDEEQKAAVAEGLQDVEQYLFELLQRDGLSKKDRERLKQGSRQLLEALKMLIGPMHDWWEKEQTRAEVEVEILDRIFEVIPMPPYDEGDAQKFATEIYNYIWQRSAAGAFPKSPAA